MRRSRIDDVKDIFKHEDKENAFKKRYGKPVKIVVTYDINGKDLKSMDDLVEYTLNFKSGNGNDYSITEFLKDGLTDKVLFIHNNNGRVVENIFQRFVDAEISLADKISEE